MSDGLKLLGAIIDTGSVHTLRDLQEEIFIEEEVALYAMMRRHYRRYGQIPAIATVEEELGITIPEAPETVDYYIKRVHDRRLYSVIREKFNSLKESLRDFDMDRSKDLIDEMRLATRVNHSNSDIRSLSEASVDVLREYDYAHENPGVSGVPTGWVRFDNRVGGYQPGDLVSWVARPNMGKTYIMLKQASAAWQFGYSVLVVTMEMTIEQIARRVNAIQAGLNPDFIRKGTLSQYARNRLQNYVDTMVGAERFKMFSGGLRKKVSDIEVLIQEYNPDIVFIDGVYMMQPESKRATSKVEKVSEVYDELKKLTLAHNIPVVVTTQFNRTAGKKGKEGSLENIAFSDAISTHSSLVISLREGEGSDLIKKTQRIATFLKGREGEEGDFKLHYSFSPINFDEVFNPETDSENGDGIIIQQTQRNVDFTV